jgi:hypothetical protein
MKANFRFSFVVFCFFIISYSSIAQWTRTNLTNSGYPSCIVVNDTNIFVGTGSGVYRSSDNGTSWKQVNTGLTTTGINAMILKGQNLFVGTTSSGIFRSNNNGESWTQTNTGLTSPWIMAFAIDDTLLYAGAYAIIGSPSGDFYGGVLCSSNDGASWSASDFALEFENISSIGVSHSSSGTSLFAAAHRGFFRSTNNGADWTDIHAPMAGRFSSFASIPSSNGEEDTCIFAATAGTNANGIFLSMDNGTNWTSINNGLTDLSVLKLLTYPNFGRTKSTILFAGTHTKGLFFSSDHGSSWSIADSELTGLNIFALATYSNRNDGNDYLFAGIDNAVWRRPLRTGWNREAVSIHMSAGWNLVSESLVQTNDSGSAVFPGAYGGLHSYDPTAGYYAQMPVLTLGVGYWIYYISETTENVTGFPLATNLSISCKRGWNLIGGREVTVNVSEISSIPANQIFGNPQWYDASAGRYQEATTLDPGVGVWIYVLSDCTIYIP